MKHFIFLSACVATLGLRAQPGDSAMLRRLYDFYLTKGHAYQNLEYLCSKIGNRVSGSPQAAEAVKWAQKAMYEAGADTVFLQPCMVPHWVRGKKESCRLNSTKLKLDASLTCLALGSSIGTGAPGLRANVIEVGSFEELEKLGEKAVSGKIVFYNVFFNQALVRPMDAYGESAKYRARGASHAAKYGAAGCVVRSMTSVADDVPHTGNMFYDSTISTRKIPAVALGYKSADVLHNALLKDPQLQLSLETHCQNLPPVPSFNVVGQLTGREKPREFIITGGHLDSWDVGQGAQDDGAGVVQSIEILAAFKNTGIQPKHSIRAVAFMNEENGLAGGDAYARFAREKNEKHLAALETDAGGYTPRGFGVDTTGGLYKLALKWKPLFAPYLIEKIYQDGSGADLRSLEKQGVSCIGFEPDNQRYFDIHHTEQDTFDKVNKRELDLGAGAIGALLYLIDKYY